MVQVETAADAFGKGNHCGIGGWLRFPSGRIVWFSQLFEVQQFTALGIPVQSDANLDISSYETLAQCFVLLAFWKCSGAGRLAIKLPALSDNSGAEAVCNKLYTSKAPLNLFVRKLCMWSALSGVALECSHIAGEQNDDADFLSRWNGDASTLPSRFRPEDRFVVDLPAFWNVAFSVSLFPRPSSCGSSRQLTHLAQLLRSQANCLSFPLLAFVSGQYRVAASFGLPVSSPGFS